MKKNTGLKVLTGAVVGVAALILMNGGHHTNDAKPTAADPNNLNEAIASQFNDNIRDVAARLQETEKKLATIEKQNQSHTQPKNNTPELTKEIDTLKEQINQLKESRQPQPETSNYPINGESPNTTTTKSTIQDIDLLLMKQINNPAENAYWENLNSKRKALTDKAKTISTPPKSTELKGIPYYTIPAGSDLGHTTLLSALIGEVPVEGKLMQPLFPFSAIINRGDLMAANGIPLPPEVSGMKVNGYAIGVGSFLDNISCVRAYVTSALFLASKASTSPMPHVY